MECVTLVSMMILIKGFPTKFFKISRGLRQGYAMFLLLFILVMDSLSRSISGAKANGIISGCPVIPTSTSVHLLFIDDVLQFGAANFLECEKVISDPSYLWQSHKDYNKQGKIKSHI